MQEESIAPPNVAEMIRKIKPHFEDNFMMGDVGVGWKEGSIDDVFKIKFWPPCGVNAKGEDVYAAIDFDLKPVLALFEASSIESICLWEFGVSLFVEYEDGIGYDIMFVSVPPEGAARSYKLTDSTLEEVIEAAIRRGGTEP